MKEAIRWIARWLLLVASLGFMAVWCLVLVPMFHVTPIVAYCISVPIGYGVVTGLVLLWWDP